MGEWTSGLKCPNCSRIVGTRSGATLALSYGFSLLRRSGAPGEPFSDVPGVYGASLSTNGDRVLADSALSTDAGKTFSPLPARPGPTRGLGLTASSVCAFAETGGIARRVDGGGFGPFVGDFTLSVSSPSGRWDAAGDRIFAIGTTAKGPALARSSDGCSTWSYLAPPAADVNQVGITDSGVVVTNGVDYWRSTDDGATFTALPRPTTHQVDWIDGRVGPTSELELTVAGSVAPAVAVTRKGEGAWTQLDAPKLEGPCFTDCGTYFPNQWVDPGQGTIFRATGGLVWGRFGGEWTPRFGALRSWQGRAWFDGNRAFTGFNTSADGGRTWSAPFPPYESDVGVVGHGFDAAGVAWRSFRGALQRSTDLSSWTTTYTFDSPTPRPRAFVVAPDRLYMFDNGGSFDLYAYADSYYTPPSLLPVKTWSSTDGITWTELPARWTGGFPIGPHGALVNLLDDGVEVSWDGGETKEKIALARKPYLVKAAAGRLVVGVPSPMGKACGGLFLLERR